MKVPFFTGAKTNLDIQVGWTNPSPPYRKDINYSNIAEKEAAAEDE